VGEEQRRVRVAQSTECLGFAPRLQEVLDLVHRLVDRATSSETRLMAVSVKRSLRFPNAGSLPETFLKEQRSHSKGTPMR